MSSSGKRALHRPDRTGRPLPCRRVPLAIAVLFIAGGFHLYRGAPVEGVVFWVVATMLTMDHLGWLKKSVRNRRFRLDPGRSVALAVVGGLLLMALPRAGVGIAVVISAVGVLGLALVWPDPAPEATVPPAVDRGRLSATAWAWATVATAACIYELAVYFLGDGRGREAEFPALSDLLGPGVEHIWGRGVFIAVWLSAGLTLLRWASRDHSHVSGHDAEVTVDPDEGEAP